MGALAMVAVAEHYDVKTTTSAVRAHPMSCALILVP